MANNGYKVNLDVDFKTENAEKDWKEFTDTLLKDWKKTQSSLRGLGDSEARPFKQITSAFSDILTKRGTFRKAIDQDTNYFQKRTHELTEYLTRDIKSASTKIKSEISDIGKKFKEETDEMSKNTSGSFLGNLKNKIGELTQGIRYRAGVFYSYRAISGVAEGFNTVARSTVELQSRFANIQAITSATDTDMAKLRETILKVGEASKFSVEDIAEATTQLGQAGLTANEINDVLETTTQLAAATGANLSNTIDLMTSALAVWGLNSEEASHLSDVMVTGMNRTKATLETFRMAVQYAGATMASLNVNFDEFASVAAAAANAGVRASVIGTGLRAMTAELISPTKRMVKGLADLGLTTDDVNIASKGLVNVLQTLKDAGLNASNAYDLFGKRAAQFVLAAEGQLDVTTQLQVAFAESGATLKAYGIQMDTVAAQWTAMANTIKEAAYKIATETHGFIHDILSGIRNFITNAMEGSVDDLNKTTGEYKNIIKSLESYQNILDQINTRDYKDDEKAIKDTNDLIESVNKLFNKNIDLVKSTEELAEARQKAADALKEEKKAQVELYNANINKTRGEVVSSNFEEFRKRLVAYKSKPEFLGGNPDLVNSVIGNKNFEDVLLNDFWQKVIEYEKLIKENDLNKSGIQSEISEMQDGLMKDLAQSAFYAASDLVKDIKFEKIEFEENEEQRKLIKEYRTKLAQINTNLESMLIENREDISDLTADTIDSEYGWIQLGIEDIKEQLEKDTTLKPEDKTKLIESLNSAETSLKDKFLKLLRDLAELWEGDVKADSFNQLIKQNQNLTPLQQAIQDRKDQDRRDEEIKRRQRESSRTAKEAERERARRFNQKYQRFSLQTQADSYAQDIAEAQRKGVISKLQTQETTGDLSSYYSTVAADLSKLESLKTALANKKTFEAYQKDYGEIFKQVRDGQVTLEDAEYKTDGVISKMIELDKNIKSAEAEFGDLNSIDLSDIDSQITTLNEKLKVIGESGESEFSKLKMGFAATVESMSKSYSSAKIGSTIAEDFGNGMSDALYSVADGTKSMKEAFSGMARSILQDISKMLIKMSVLKAMEMGVGMFFGGGEQPVVAGGESGTGAIYGGVYGNGGFVPKLRAAAGKLVRGGIQGRDSVPAMVMPGEYILKKSAVDALGTNFLNDLNNNAAQTLAGTAASLAVQNPWEESSDSEPAVVNVWVVSKEEEAQMGPNDIIATIGKDIMTGGQTRRLIQSVVAGRK